MLDMDDHWELWDPPADFIDRSKLAGLPRHGIGRAMKVSKEEIVALITAIAIFAQEDRAAEVEQQRTWLQRIADALQGAHVCCELRDGDDPESAPSLEIAICHSSPATALDLCRQLRQSSPPMYVGHGKLHEGKLVINPTCLCEDDVQPLLQRLGAELRR